MTREEAILILRNEQPHCGGKYRFVEEQRYEAFEMAIKALEQQTCEDAISREDALMALTGEWTESRDEILSLAIRRIRTLPSVNPQHTDEEIQKMQELEQAEIQRAYELGKVNQQTCEDAVSRKDVLNLVDNLNDGSFRWASIRTKIARLHLVQPELEPCEDAISRQAVLGLFAQNADAVRPYSKTWEEVKALPSVNPQPICEEREKGECPYYAG